MSTEIPPPESAVPVEAPPSEPVPEMFAAVFSAMNSAFGSLGRGLVCLDQQFGILHLSPVIEQLIGPLLSESLPGQPASVLLGDELFGPGGSMRQGLLQGERQEGWHAVLRTGAGGGREVSVTAAPLTASSDSTCDPGVRWIVVVRPAEEDVWTGTSAPTVFEGLIGRSPVMGALFDLIRTLSHSDATILLTGESGTGKEVVARAIHATSDRRARPFVAVNCAALPEQLLEAELFGHVRGAFTGAVRDRVGRFELASGGTLLLDEVGDMSPRLQAGLLRVLQEQTFQRVGESRTRSADVRVIAATNLDLEQAVADGVFREDLFYRLRVVPIELPPLRDRREDIAPLARHLLARVGARHGRMLRLSPEALRELMRLDWPGNVRQLENALEYAVAVCQGQTVHVSDLPPETFARRRARGGAASRPGALPPGGPRDLGRPASPRSGDSPGSSTHPGADLAGPGSVGSSTSASGGLGAGPDGSASVGAPSAPRPSADPGAGPQAGSSAASPVDDGGVPTLHAILDALETHRWRRAAAAEALGISRTTLWRRMRELRLK